VAIAMHMHCIAFAFCIASSNLKFESRPTTVNLLNLFAKQRTMIFTCLVTNQFSLARTELFKKSIIKFLQSTQIHG